MQKQKETKSKPYQTLQCSNFCSGFFVERRIRLFASFRLSFTIFDSTIFSANRSSSATLQTKHKHIINLNKTRSSKKKNFLTWDANWRANSFLSSSVHGTTRDAGNHPDLPEVPLTPFHLNKQTKNSNNQLIIQLIKFFDYYIQLIKFFWLLNNKNNQIKSNQTKSNKIK